MVDTSEGLFTLLDMPHFARLFGLGTVAFDSRSLALLRPFVGLTFASLLCTSLSFPVCNLADVAECVGAADESAVAARSAGERECLPVSEDKLARTLQTR